MARTGRFGRLPRSSPDLTATIVGMIREYNNQVDQNITNAWKNGGLVDGKPVTDTRFLDHLRQRRDELSKDDPLWDQWNDALIQQTFGIAESKMNLKFKQGKASAHEVSAFYTHQLKNIPKNSAFYRDIAGRAADWAKSAAGAARGAARGRAMSGLQAKLDGVQDTFNDYEAARHVITAAAQKANIISGNQSIEDASALDMQRLFEIGLTFHGVPLTWNSFQKMSVATYNAFETNIQVNKQLNRGTKELTNQKQNFLDRNLVAWNAIDDRAKVESAMQLHSQKVADANGDPDAILAADASTAKTLNGILAIAGKMGKTDANDPLVIGQIQEAISVLTTGKGIGGQDAEAPGIKAIQDTHNTAADNSAALANHTAYYGQDKFGGPMDVFWYPPSANATGAKSLPENFQQGIVKDKDGKEQTVTMVGQTVGAAVISMRKADGTWGAIDPTVTTYTPADLATGIRTGQLKIDEGMQTVGYVFQGPSPGGNAGTRHYGTYGADGKLTFTAENPFAGPLMLTPDGTPFVAVPSDGVDKNGNQIPKVTMATDPRVTATGAPVIADGDIKPSRIMDLVNTGKLDVDPTTIANYATQLAGAQALTSAITGAAQTFAQGGWAGLIQSFIGPTLGKGAAVGSPGNEKGNAPPVLPPIPLQDYNTLGAMGQFVGRLGQQPGQPSTPTPLAPPIAAPPPPPLPPPTAAPTPPKPPSAPKPPAPVLPPGSNYTGPLTYRPDPGNTVKPPSTGPLTSKDVWDPRKRKQV